MMKWGNRAESQMVDDDVERIEVPRIEINRIEIDRSEPSRVDIDCAIRDFGWLCGYVSGRVDAMMEKFR